MLQLIWFALTSLVTWALPRILAAVGFYVVSTVISKTIFTFLKNQVMAQFGSLGDQFLNVLYLSGLYDGVVIVMAAYMLALSIKGAKTATGIISGS